MVSTRKRFRRPVQVLVYLVRESKSGWEYLLLRRARRIGGFWQGVTGAPKEVEELIDAADREVFEETGIKPTKITAIGYSYKFPIADEWCSLYEPNVEEIVEHVFVGRVKGEEPRLSREHDEYK